MKGNTMMSTASSSVPRSPRATHRLISGRDSPIVSSRSASGQENCTALQRVSVGAAEVSAARGLEASARLACARGPDELCQRMAGGVAQINSERKLKVKGGGGLEAGWRTAQKTTARSASAPTYSPNTGVDALASAPSSVKEGRSHVVSSTCGPTAPAPQAIS